MKKYYQVRMGNGHYFTRAKLGQPRGRVAFEVHAQALETAMFYGGTIEEITMRYMLAHGEVYYLQDASKTLHLVTQTLPIKVKGP